MQTLGMTVAALFLVLLHSAPFYDCLNSNYMLNVRKRGMSTKVLSSLQSNTDVSRIITTIASWQVIV